MGKYDNKKGNRKMNILITGVCGFVGSNLAKKLVKDGHKVYGIDNLSTGFIENIKSIIKKDNFKFINSDITIENSYIYDNLDVVIHLAAINAIPYAQEYQNETYQTNVIGTKNILAIAKNHCAKFIFAGTSAVYENTPDLPSKPYDKVNPNTTYAITKLLGENLIEYEYNKNIILRFFNIYGPAQNYRRDNPPIMSIFLRNQLEGKESILYRDGDKSRDFIYVDDVVNAIIAAMNSETYNVIYNVGTGKDINLIDLYKECEEITGRNIKFTLSSDDIVFDALRTQADISLTKQMLDWKPKTTLKKGLKIQYEWLKKELKYDSN